MAQTKKKRRSKHRGNAAGVVEARGRTGRKPTAEERKLSDKERAAQARRDRMMRPPSWRSATIRAAMAAVVFGLLLALAFGQNVGQAVLLTAFVFLFYIPLGYFTDSFIYRHRVRSEAKKAALAKAQRAETSAPKPTRKKEAS
jgi:ABC-type transport system involved in cytochrome bd biosynthesis fused ATPase/permease subunit